MEARRLTILRTHGVSKLMAIVFALLILSPVTAPFPTLLLACSPSNLPFEDTSKDFKSKVGSDEVALVSDHALLLPDACAVIIDDACAAHQLASHTPLRLTLRV